MPDTILTRNPNHPGKTYPVDRAKYEAMRAAMLEALPDAPAGLAVPALKEKLLPSLPVALFPGGATAGWWLKCVQLDLEAQGIVLRALGSPVRLRRAASG